MGTPPQKIQVLASTQVASSWVVAPNGCTSKDASNCTQVRGGSFDTNQSSSWTPKDIYQLDAEVNLGYTGNSLNGTYGFDTLAISQATGSAVPAQHQVVADIITERFYIGTLGLNAAPVNFSTSDPSDSAISLLASLKNQNSIPSQSFGYTAGASYKEGGVNSSLTLGGYDASRFIPNDVSFTFAPAKTRQLVASVQSITYADSKGQQPLMSGGILALVDSTVPYLWLPQTACQAFENTFGISWDPIANLYLVNETTHSTLIKTNPSVIFEISNSLAGGPSVNITLPYASFDLTASYPLVKSQQRYFPLQIAADENSYTLGRTFLQEAFMIVNFENSTFSLSQAVYDSQTPSHIVAISPSSGNGTSPSPSSTAALTAVPNGGSGGIGAGAIAGIVIAFILIAIISAVAFFCLRRRRKKAREVAELPGDGPVTDKTSPMSDVKESTFFKDNPPPKNQSTPAVTIAEVPMTPPMSPPLSGIGVNEYYHPTSPGSPLKPSELAGDKPPRSELSSPERPSTPIVPSELPSPDPQDVRSELSTPEPLFPEQELPTPDPSHELRAENSLKKKREPDTTRSSQALPSRIASSQVAPSPAMVSPTIVSPAAESEAMQSPAVSFPADRSAADSETDSHHALSALNSPRLPLQRPRSLRMDSSDSESPFTRDGLPTRAFSAQGHYRRQDSSSSDLPTTSNFPPRRPLPRRNDTDSSEQSNISQLSPTVGPRPQLARMFPSGSATFIAVRPPHNRGLSQDSDTWETRLEMGSASEGESPGVEGRANRADQQRRVPSAMQNGNGQREYQAAQQHTTAASEPLNMNSSEAQQVGPMQQQQQGHRRAVSEDEERIREGLVGGGVLRQSQTEEPEPYARGALQEG